MQKAACKCLQAALFILINQNHIIYALAANNTVD